MPGIFACSQCSGTSLLYTIVTWIDTRQFYSWTGINQRLSWISFCEEICKYCIKNNKGPTLFIAIILSDLWKILFNILVHEQHYRLQFLSLWNTKNRIRKEKKKKYILFGLFKHTCDLQHSTYPSLRKIKKKNEKWQTKEIPRNTKKNQEEEQENNKTQNIKKKTKKKTIQTGLTV